MITENISDALPNKRYILFRAMHPGYSVNCLAPHYETKFEKQDFPDSPPRIILLPDDKVWVGVRYFLFLISEKANIRFHWVDESLTTR